MLRKKIEAFSKKYFVAILLFLIFASLAIDSVRILAKPLDLSSGQTQSWWEVAYNVEHGNGYKACNDSYVPNCALTNQYTAMREPVPVLLFALVGKLSNDSPFALLLLLIVFYLLIFLGLFLLGRRVGGLEIGLLSLFLWTFYLPQERIEDTLTGDLLSGAFTVFGFYIFARIAQKNQWRDWLGFGLVMGLAALSRSAMLVVALTLVGGYILYFRARSVPFKDVVWKGVLSIVMLVITLSPWVIRNYLVFREPVIGTSLIGYNLYRHNSFIANDANPHYVGPEEAYQQVQDLVARRPELKTALDEVQVDAVFRDEAVKIILANPVSYAKLVVYRFLPLWFNIGIREQYNDQTSVLDYIVILQQLVLLAAFILGLWHGDRLLRLYGLSVLVYSMSYLAIDSQLRYLIPMMPVVILIGSIGIVHQWDIFAKRKTKGVLPTPAHGA